MNNLTNLLAKAQTNPWAILPEKMNEIAAFLSLREAGVVKAEPDDEEMEPGENGGDVSKAGKLAVVRISGTIIPHATLLSNYSGGTSAFGLEQTFNALAADENVSGVMVLVDSPGGNAVGVAEASSALYALSQKKPTAALIQGVGASAAYWIASAARNVYLTESSIAGSIGTLSVRFDESEHLASEGYKYEITRSTELKALGHSSEPVTDEERSETNRLVGFYTTTFINHIARNRGITMNQANALHTGQVFAGQESVTAGLTDGVMTPDAVLAKLAGEVAAEEKVEALQAAYTDLHAKYTEALSRLETIGAQLKADAAAAQTAKIDAFVNQVVRVENRVPPADEAALRADLEANFDLASRATLRIPVNAAKPTELDTPDAAVPAPVSAATVGAADDTDLTQPMAAYNEEEVNAFKAAGLPFVKAF